MSNIEQNARSEVSSEVVVETEETKSLREKFSFFCPAALVYALFYTFCMYKNGSGITFLFFVGSSLLFLYFSLSKLGLTLKKGSIFYMAAMVLLGISTFCTDDARIIFFNKLGVFLLIMSLLLKQYCDTSKWNLGKFLGSICVLIIGSIGELKRPISDAKDYRRRNANKTDKRIWYFVQGLLIGVPLLGVVLLLLSSADAVFREMTKGLFDGIEPGNIFNVLLRISSIFFGSYALLSFLSKRVIKDGVADRRKGEPILAITATGMLTLLYLLFSGIQIMGLFLGKLQLPEGYTYAMYAREGFFQLLAVSMLNLVIVLACISLFKESKILKIILTAMSLCTFIMIASSALRMVMYIRYYYLTFLRILVLWGLILLAVLFLGVVVHIFKESFPLFRYSMVVVTVLYLALSFAHPDYIIAKVNVANAPRESESWVGGEFFLADEPYHDYAYLRNLSADAAPVLVPYLEELGYHTEAFWKEDALEYAMEKGWADGVSRVSGFGYYWMRELQQSTEDLGIRTFNVSRWLALKGFE